MNKLNIANLQNSVEFAGSVSNTAIGGTAALVIIVIGVHVITHRPVSA